MKKNLAINKIKFYHTLFLKTCNNHITCLITFFDEIIIIGIKSEISIQRRKLFQEFEMRDQGNLKYFIKF